MTMWKMKKSDVETRQKGWLKRYAHKIDESYILRAPPSFEMKREKRLIESGWRNILCTEPERPVPEKYFDFEHTISSSQSKRSNICYLCWALVSYGSDRIHCRKCPVIAHRKCAIDVENLRVPSILLTSPASSTSSSPPLSPAEKEKNWTCLFCHEELQSTTAHREKRLCDSRRKHNEICATLKLQSFSRMAVRRVTFRRARHGIIKLQRLFRSLRFWKKAEKDKADRMRPFRVRLHHIHLFVKINDGSVEVPQPVDHIVGETMASIYDQVFGTEAAAPSMESMEMMNLLRAGHVEAPTYSMSFKMSESRNVPKGSLFLSLSVHETRGPDTYLDPRQLFRVDTLLKLEGRPSKITLPHLRHLGFKSMSEKQCEMLNSQYRLAKFGLQKPYFLFPACNANATVRLTISKVADLPRTIIVGQTNWAINSNLLWKRCLTIHQGMETRVSFDSVPSQDEHAKLNLVIKRARIKTKMDSLLKPLSSNGWDTMSEGSGPLGSPSRTKVAGILGTGDMSPPPHAAPTDELSHMVFEGGVVTWSLLPVSYEANNYAGYVSAATLSLALIHR